MNSIGIDLHSASIFVTAVNSKGKIIFSNEYGTSVPSLIAAVEKMSGPRQVMVEECHLAQWAKSVLEPYVDKFIVCDPRHNDWICKDDRSDDRSSAYKLARLLWMQEYKEIPHPDDNMAALRSLFVMYDKTNRDITRFKNRMTSAFRQVAIDVPKSAVYDPAQRRACLKLLKNQKHLEIRASIAGDMVDRLEQAKVEVFKAVKASARKQTAYRLLQTVPGVGEVLAAGYIATIGTPERFSHENKLWIYAGLGNRHHESGGTTYEDKASQTGNRVLKWVVGEHFIILITRCRKPNRFAEFYDRRRQQDGADDNAARRDTCRRILSVVRAIWLSGEPYRDDHVSKP